MGHPRRPLFVYFQSYSNKHLYNNLPNLKNVRPVYIAGIRTHNLQIASLVPYPLDHSILLDEVKSWLKICPPAVSLSLLQLSHVN